MGITTNHIGGSAGVFRERDRQYIRVPTTEGAGGVNRQNDRLAAVAGTVINGRDAKSNRCKPLRPRRYREGRDPVRVGHTAAERVVRAVRRRPGDGCAHAGRRGNILNDFEGRRYSITFNDVQSIKAPIYLCLRLCGRRDDERQQQGQTQQTGRGKIRGGGGGDRKPLS